MLDLIYPRKCGICEEISDNYLCINCKEKLNISVNVMQYNNRHFDKHIYVAKYENLLRETILKYKFKEKSYLYRLFVEILINEDKICSFCKKYDIMIPVPIHRKRKLDRGYNQSELISKELAKRLGIKYRDVLYKTKNNISQTKFNKLERIENVKGIYKIKEIDLIKNKKIILFDDIYTTGATLEECSKVLKDAGASKVSALTIMKD